ncbi:MAG: hypothetical protein V3T48_10720, partial [Vicinamibacterales bacterium]
PGTVLAGDHPTGPDPQADVEVGLRARRGAIRHAVGKIRPDAFAEDPDRLAPGALEASESATKTPSSTASMLASQCGK